MEEEKKQGEQQVFQLNFIVAVTGIERFQQEIISSTKTDLELLDSARLGISDYDYDSVKIIK